MDTSYMTVKEAADRWGISERRVRALFHADKLAGARKSGVGRTSAILIPTDTAKPSDGRRLRAKVRYTELSQLYVDCDEKRAALDRLKPLGNNALLALKSYDSDFLLRFVYNSNAIEGSTLSLRDTELVLEGEFVPDESARWQFAARGVYEGTFYARKLAARDARISRELIQDVHEHTALDLQPGARGVFRRYPVYIRGSRTVPVAWESIYDALGQLLYDYSHFEGHDIERIALFHCRFEGIHPFGDCNGRTGRILLNAMLEDCGYPPVALKATTAREYFNSLERAQADNKPQDFIRMLIEQVNYELDGRIRAAASSGSDDPARTNIYQLYRLGMADDGSKLLVPKGRYSSLLAAIESVDALPADERSGRFAVYSNHQDVLCDTPLWTSDAL